MPTYVVEHDIPGAGGWSAEQMRTMVEKSRAVLCEMGPEIQWVTSYVTGDKLCSVCIAPSPELIREHAVRGGFPCNRVSSVHAMIDPTAAEQTTSGQRAAYVREAGAGDPVICIHASASSSAQWRPLTDRLAGRFRTLAVDLYGCGRSPEWRGYRPLLLADEAALLEPVLAATGTRFHLIGHSYGGAVALKVALAHPGRIASLVVFEPVLFSLLMAEDPDQPAAREIDAVRADTSAAVDHGDLATAGTRFVDYWMGGGAWAAMPEARRLTVATAMERIKGQWHALFEEPAPLPAFAALGVPTLCLVGSDSPASSRAVSRLLAKALPRVTEVELDGVGHMGPVTHPDRVNALIERYLTGGLTTPTE
jgi:pimeloyl-ACP methyl ester carboxylesterase